jgi:hypothetical protein
MGFYNRATAVRYATTWALNYNPFWVSDASSNGGGGDCTNFISQSLFAGGWSMVHGMKRDYRAWYGRMLDSDRDDRSWTWAGADPFSKFLQQSGRARRCSFNELTVGDLIQEKIDGRDHVSHTMLVTKVGGWGRGKTVFLTYHSTNYLNTSFNDVTNRAGKDASFVYWKLMDLYLEYTLSYPILNVIA